MIDCGLLMTFFILSVYYKVVLLFDIGEFVGHKFVSTDISWIE